MRKYPAAGIATMRIASSGKDVVLAGGKFVLPGGCAIHMPISAVQRGKALWDNPENFCPERFLEV